MESTASHPRAVWKNPATDWLRDARYGLCLHFLGYGCETAEQWNRRVAQFDVEAVAEQAAEVRAGYAILTLTQRCAAVMAPNAALDAALAVPPGTYCATRDVPWELGRALEARGIGLFLYVPGDGMIDGYWPRRLLGWDEQRDVISEAFLRHWCAAIREWSLRYGELVRGWWFDGCRAGPDVGHTNQTVARLYFAAKEGNPRNVVAINPGARFGPFQRLFDYEDYIAGHDVAKEEPGPVPDGRWLDGAQWHALLHLGSKWGRADGRFSTAQWVSYAQRVVEREGVLTFDCGPRYPEDETRTGPVGSISEPQMQQLRAIRDAVRV